MKAGLDATALWYQMWVWSTDKLMIKPVHKLSLACMLNRVVHPGQPFLILHR